MFSFQNAESDGRVAYGETKAGALPRKSLVVYDPILEMATDVFPCEDGHAQERSLFGQVLPTVEKMDVWIMDSIFRRYWDILIELRIRTDPAYPNNSAPEYWWLLTLLGTKLRINEFY